jgi:uncharacterized protein YcgI (DUF1989 family)
MKPSRSQTPPPSSAGTKGVITPALTDEERAHHARLTSSDHRTLVSEVEIPAREGRSITVPQGTVLRVTCHEGPQVGDMTVFNANEPDEKFWSARTRVIHGGHLKVEDRLWSTPPHTRPMMTIIADTLNDRRTEDGAKPHDLLFCRCDSRHYEINFGDASLPNCQDNLASAIAPHGLDANQVHDPLNLFMTTGLNEEGRPYYQPSISDKGDYIEFLAEMDCLVAISACPGGSSGSASFGLMLSVFQEN